MDKLPITLAIFVKDEEKSIRDCIESVRLIVSEIVVLDTGSTDNTVELCKKFTNRVYEVGFTDFGRIRTLTAHLATQPWVLMLDADERLSYEDWPRLAELVAQAPGVKGDNMELDEDGNVIIDSWALPRKRWADAYMNQQVEKEAYPDWQVRLFRNHTDKRIHYVRRVHETIKGCIRTEKTFDVTINHFQNVNKDKEALKKRQEHYNILYKADLEEGISHDHVPIVSLDIV